MDFIEFHLKKSRIFSNVKGFLFFYFSDDKVLIFELFNP